MITLRVHFTAGDDHQGVNEYHYGVRSDFCLVCRLGLFPGHLHIERPKEVPTTLEIPSELVRDA